MNKAREALNKAAQDLNCPFRNDNSLDLETVNLQETTDWLKAEGFIESKVRKGRWIKQGVELILDSHAGFLYIPSI